MNNLPWMFQVNQKLIEIPNFKQAIIKTLIQIRVLTARDDLTVKIGFQDLLQKNIYLKNILIIKKLKKKEKVKPKKRMIMLKNRKIKYQFTYQPSTVNQQHFSQNLFKRNQRVITAKTWDLNRQLIL